MSMNSRGGLVASVATAFAACGLLVGIPSGAANAATTFGSYYEDAGALTCNSNQCIVYFSNLPADKTLFAQKVSCRIVTSDPAAFSEMELTSKLAAESNRFVATWTATSAGHGYYLANADVLHIASTQPFVRMKTKVGQVGQIYCTLFGLLVESPSPF